MVRMLKVAISGLALAVGYASAANAAGELFLYNWSDYIPPDLLKKFEADTGIKVTLDVYDSNETMLAKLQAGATGYDVIVPSDYMVAIMVREGMLENVGLSQMPNYKNVGAPFDNQEFDIKRDYTAPYLWGTTGFTYDGKRVPGNHLDESWKSFFEPVEELRGRIAVLNDEVEVWNAASYYLGIDKCTEDRQEAQKILDVLEKQKPFVAMYQSDGTHERMVAGEVIMHHQWNGAAHRTKMGLPSAVYVYPKEGITFWQDNLAVPKGAPHLEEAKTFLNWMMAPENIALASNFTGYMNAIEGSDQYMDKSLIDDPAVNMPQDYTDRLRPAKDCSAASRELRNRVWTRLKS
jgi:spermidine/putrescine transport system substrate-binding protein